MAVSTFMRLLVLVLVLALPARSIVVRLLLNLLVEGFRDSLIATLVLLRLVVALSRRLPSTCIAG